MDKEQLSQMIGEKLKQLRFERNWSLDQLAKQTGVSKPMLGQIERGESNPTVSTLWKIAKGLNVSFTAFLEEEKPNVTVVDRRNIEPITEEQESFKVYPLFLKPFNKPFEIFSVQLEPGCEHHSEPHTRGVEEYIVVEEGELTLYINEQSYTLEKGQAIHFVTDQAYHRYGNNQKEACTFTMLIYYPNSSHE
ncbi:helix-turn-helix domain-containing protein [Halalkalibacter urbisdiaboli]|uniref:helix-turn-helix domain-containing protein n=1 Tax=Halalkalibacter urbisdiaboli TaxID=1960589 RepID=UPI000B436F58|nr:XRE family transcriptional regulator [Halalkalibacter urbisdiaboli]